MKRVLCAFVLLSAFLVAALPGVARAAADCAFQDVNDNGIFDGGDIIVPDAQWIGGTAFVTNHPFVVPAGCVLPDLVGLPGPLFGVQVTATKITFLGTLTYVPPGGRGVLFIADPTKVPAPGLGDGSITIGDGVASGVKIEAGGANLLPVTIPAVPKKSVALLAAGKCTINKAELIGNRPIQDTKVGINCNGDIVIRQALIKGSRVNIQSQTGKIDGRSFTGPVGANLANACDDPVLNIVAGKGNGNGVLDAGDFPCQINLAAVGAPPGTSPVFNSAAALLAFCTDPTLGGINIFQAFNDPMIMISKTDLDLRGVAGFETEVLGRYHVHLIAEDGNVNTSNTHIHHGLLPPGGAQIFVFANPAIANRLPVDHEDVFGPSTGTTDITDACYESPSPVRIGRDAALALNLIGVPDGPPCRQIVGGFIGVLNGNF